MPGYTPGPAPGGRGASLGAVRRPGTVSLTRYLVELSGAAGALAGIQALAERARGAALEVARDGTSVRFLRVVFVPDDESCFLLYEGESEEAIGRALAGAEIGMRRVARVLDPADLAVRQDTHGP